MTHRPTPTRSLLRPLLALGRGIVSPNSTKGQPREELRRLTIRHGGVDHQVRVKRVATASRLTLRVRAASRDVVLTVPVRCSAETARTFAAKHAAWIGERLGALRPRIVFEPGTLIPFRGEPHRLMAAKGLRRRVWIEAAPDGQACLWVSGPGADFAADVERFLRAEAGQALSKAVAAHAATVGRPVRRITLRDTKSRWGSCSATGSLNFSWRLILAPPLILDYLAAHEVAHLVHLDHSDAFWTLTRKLAPRMDEAEAWLKRHGAALHDFGPAGRE